MANVLPFKGILYNPGKTDISSAVAPPYDVVTPRSKEVLYKKSSYNIIRIDFGKDKDIDNDEENRYTRASAFLSDWLKQGILIHDPEPSYYCYEITYLINGQTNKARGFLGAVKIEELGSGRIHPHEETYSKPKSDRMNIMRYCQANTSPIFSLYSSEEKLASSVLETIVKESPFIEAVDGDDFTHRLWRISESSMIETIKKDLSGKDIFIADGHHRYETALAFRKEMEEKGLNITGDEPFNYVLMFLANMEEEGISLLPTHRIVEIDSEINVKETLEKYFDIQKTSSDDITQEQAVEQMFNTMKKSKHVFGMYMTNANTYYTLTFNRAVMDLDLPDCLKTLDVSVLHKIVFEKLLKIGHYEYEMDPAIAVERAQRDSFEAVFFLNPTRINDVKEVALAGHRMPPKSTYFFPKLLTGMVMYSFRQ